MVDEIIFIIQKLSINIIVLIIILCYSFVGMISLSRNNKNNFNIVYRKSTFIDSKSITLICLNSNNKNLKQYF